MKYQDATVKRMLAAEYVLGTLHGRARRRFERLARERADVQAEVRYWEDRLARLQHRFKPVTPRAVVWAAIEREIGVDKVVSLDSWRAPAAEASTARSPRWLQAWAGMATAASVVLSFALYREVNRPLPPPQLVRVEVPVAQPLPYVAMLHPQGVDAEWLVTVSPERKLIRVSASGKYPINRSSECLELWVLGEDGKPRSLGVLPNDGSSDLPMPRGVSMPKDPTLAVSKEPIGGSPTGAPTGPVILATPAQRVS